MQFDAVEAGGLGVFSSLAELLDDAGNLVGRECARRRESSPGHFA
jgi:hypothetical protein